MITKNCSNKCTGVGGTGDLDDFFCYQFNNKLKRNWLGTIYTVLYPIITRGQHNRNIL